MTPSLLSAGFLLPALAAVLLLPPLRGAVRQLGFLALNLLFVFGVVLEPVGAFGTAGFVVLGYLFTWLAARHGRPALVSGVVVLTLLFVWMRRYDVLAAVLPAQLLTGLLSTVGLSFLFFKIIHLMVDARAGVLGPVTPADYLNYCFNFTTFLMGPIQRFQDYRAQWTLETDTLPRGFEAQFDQVLRVLLGLVKAYVVAPWLQERALQPDTVLVELSLKGWIVQTYAFWWFLYFNFSGYCDVVIGVGSLMGVRPPENFNKPWLAANISDFWQRQHRSLTLWLTDYVFTPVYANLLGRPGFARHRLAAANLSLAVTMLVSGLWHGTTMAFLCFGLVHGLWFVIYRSWDALLVRRLGRQRAAALRSRPAWRLAGMFLTFNATAFAFIFFQVRWPRIADALARLT